MRTESTAALSDHVLLSLLGKSDRSYLVSCAVPSMTGPRGENWMFCTVEVAITGDDAGTIGATHAWSSGYAVTLCSAYCR